MCVCVFTDASGVFSKENVCFSALAFVCASLRGAVGKRRRRRRGLIKESERNEGVCNGG